MIPATKGTRAFIDSGGSASRPPGFTAILPSQAMNADGPPGGSSPPGLVWPRGQRSGYIPAEPYPAPVCTSVGDCKCFGKSVVVVGREK